MLGEEIKIATTSISMLISPLSIDYANNSYLATVTPNKSSYVKGINLGSQKNYADSFFSFDKSSKVKDKFFQLLNLKEISSDVYNNAYNLLVNLPAFILAKMDIECIYASQYGTIMIDFEFPRSTIFSLEIGKNSVGYFSEINSLTFSFCDELKTMDEAGNTLNSTILSNDIECFLNELNIV